MRRIRRDDIVDYATYEDRRDAFRAQVLEAKRRRRVHIGAHLTLLFENALTMRYQVQEMMRAERIVRERDIQHEIETYNEVLGDEGELGGTLLIEIEDAAERTRRLSEWRALPEHLYVLLEDGTKVRARVDERQRSDDSLSAVQYVRFAVGGRVPVAAGVDLPAIATETPLSDEQRAALREDLVA